MLLPIRLLASDPAVSDHLAPSTSLKILSLLASLANLSRSINHMLSKRPNFELSTEFDSTYGPDEIIVDSRPTACLCADSEDLDKDVWFSVLREEHRL